MPLIEIEPDCAIGDTGLDCAQKRAALSRGLPDAPHHDVFRIVCNGDADGGIIRAIRKKQTPASR